MSPTIKSYRDLTVWQRSVALAGGLYGVTRNFPAFERFGMSSQTQRAGVSIPSNIAEGHGKSGSGDLPSHLALGRRSLRTGRTLLLIAHRIGCVEAATYTALFERNDKLSRRPSGRS